MTENGKKERKALKYVLGVLGTLIVMALVYAAAVLLQSPADALEGSFVVEDDEVITRMQPVEASDADSLASAFGAPLPMLPGFSPRGQAGNTTHDGQTVRAAALQYEGLMITAVRPASAAPLLLREELSVAMRSDLTVLGHPAVLADRGGAHCVYFTSESAAYSVYTPGAPEEDFLALLKRLVWAN